MRSPDPRIGNDRILERSCIAYPLNFLTQIRQPHISYQYPYHNVPRPFGLGEPAGFRSSG